MARALYIHWPFCLKKCPYCDFNSHVRKEVDISAWQAGLLADMHHEASLAGQDRLDSIFFGGGTPSLMPPQLVATLLEEAERLWGFSAEIEITLEANPSSVESSRFADLASAGVNRVSLGLQALEDDALHFLGRLHNVAEGLAALEIAQGHFSRVSVDLIYARPGQSVADWDKELARAVNFGTQHLSLYQLSIEPGTRFATMVREGQFNPLHDDPAADLFAFTRERTAQYGLPAYEISNHAQPGEESRHNLAYWRYQDYCGIGPGAHGRRNNMATARHKKPENWLNAIEKSGHGIAEERALQHAEQASEALLMGLRLAEGVDLDALGTRFALKPQMLVHQEKLAFYTELGLAWQKGGRIGISEAGMSLLDALLAELVSDRLITV